MSSTATAATTATATATQPLQTLTYWCHECDMSVSLLTPPPPPSTISRSSPPPLCPHCHTHFLELMDFSSSTTTTTNTFTTPHFSCDPLTTSNTTASTAFDSDSEDDEDDFIDEPINEAPSFSLIETIPTVKITSILLDPEDSFLLCPICKDQFVLELDAKQLPCKHLYHCDCIAPWLIHHNTCPVCRFKLPIHPPPRQLKLDQHPHNGVRANEEDPAIVMADDDDDDDGDDDYDSDVNANPDDVTVLAASLPAYLRI